MEMETRTLTRADIAKMDPAEFNNLLMAAHKVEAKAVVLRADGSIKYDEPSLAGTYGEEHLEQAHGS